MRRVNLDLPLRRFDDLLDSERLRLVVGVWPREDDAPGCDVFCVEAVRPVRHFEIIFAVAFLPDDAAQRVREKAEAVVLKGDLARSVEAGIFDLVAHTVLHLGVILMSVTPPVYVI